MDSRLHDEEEIMNMMNVQPQSVHVDYGYYITFLTISCVSDVALVNHIPFITQSHMMDFIRFDTMHTLTAHNWQK